MDFKGEHIWIVYQSLEDEKVVIKEAICDWNNPRYTDLREQIAFHFLDDNKVRIVFNCKEEWHFYDWGRLYQDCPRHALFLSEQEAQDFYVNHVSLKSFIIKANRKTFHMNRDYYILEYDKNKGYESVKCRIAGVLGPDLFLTTKSLRRKANEIFVSERVTYRKIKEMNKKELEKTIDKLGNMIMMFSNKRIEKPEIGKPYTVFNPYAGIRRDNVVFQCVSEDGKTLIDTQDNVIKNTGDKLFGCGVYENLSKPMTYSQYTQYKKILNKKEFLEKALKIKN